MATDLVGGLFGGTPNYGKIAAHNEARRRGVINLGMDQINAVFQGGSAPFYSGTTGKFDPKAAYYHLGKKGEFQPYWVPHGAQPNEKFNQNMIGQTISTGGGDLGAILGVKALGLGDLFGDSDSPKEIARKTFNKGLLLSAPENKSFEGFGPAFYNAREKAYLDFALPQVSEDYRNARKAIEFGLSNRGLHQSTVADQARSDLNRRSGTARQQVADEAISQRNQAERDVEQSRQQAIAQLYQTADPAQAFQSALSTASSLRAPSTFTPIGNAFTGLADQFYLNQALNNYRQGAQGLAAQNFSIAPYLAPLN